MSAVLDFFNEYIEECELGVVVNEDTMRRFKFDLSDSC